MRLWPLYCLVSTGPNHPPLVWRTLLLVALCLRLFVFLFTLPLKKLALLPPPFFFRLALVISSLILKEGKKIALVEVVPCCQLCLFTDNIVHHPCHWPLLSLVCTSLLRQYQITYKTAWLWLAQISPICRDPSKTWPPVVIQGPSRPELGVEECENRSCGTCSDNWKAVRVEVCDFVTSVQWNVFVQYLFLVTISTWGAMLCWLGLIGNVQS